MNLTGELPSLDPGSEAPLYRQIARVLRHSIETGQFGVGQKLPSEAELVQRYGVSRITATAALDELVKAHLAYRERGRGTFVAQAFLSNFSFFSSFTEDVRARGQVPSSRVLGLGIDKPDLDTIVKLKMDDDASYVCLRRVRLTNDEPVVLQAAYLPAEMYPGIEAIDFEHRYLFDVMRREYGLKPTWADAIVEAGLPTSEEAQCLKIAVTDPVLLIWHLTSDDHFTVLEYVRSVYRSDRFSFVTGRNLLRRFDS
ncbi:MAG: GntR family transcriptional regulator [Anaerolineales bacterium]